MREILFRGKAVNESSYRKVGKWCYGYYVHNLVEDTHSIITNTFPQIKFEVDPTTVGQFTGLTDKNGAKIFEGDILKESEYGIFEVIYDTKWAKFKLDWTRVAKAIQYPEWNRGIAMEIIGNIHENSHPETCKTEN